MSAGLPHFGCLIDPRAQSPGVPEVSLEHLGASVGRRRRSGNDAQACARRSDTRDRPPRARAHAPPRACPPRARAHTPPWTRHPPPRTRHPRARGHSPSRLSSSGARASSPRTATTLRRARGRRPPRATTSLPQRRRSPSPLSVHVSCVDGASAHART